MQRSHGSFNRCARRCRGFAMSGPIETGPRRPEGNLVLPKAPLTLGQVTWQPQQFANEQNLRGVNGTGQPSAERFAAHNAGLINSLNVLGALRRVDTPPVTR